MVRTIITDLPNPSHKAAQRPQVRLRHTPKSISNEAINKAMIDEVPLDKATVLYIPSTF